MKEVNVREIYIDGNTICTRKKEKNFWIIQALKQLSQKEIDEYEIEFLHRDIVFPNAITGILFKNDKKFFLFTLKYGK